MVLIELCCSVSKDPAVRVDLQHPTSVFFPWCPCCRVMGPAGKCCCRQFAAKHDHRTPPGENKSERGGFKQRNAITRRRKEGNNKEGWARALVRGTSSKVQASVTFRTRLRSLAFDTTRATERAGVWAGGGRVGVGGGDTRNGRGASRNASAPVHFEDPCCKFEFYGALCTQFSNRQRAHPEAPTSRHYYCIRGTRFP